MKKNFTLFISIACTLNLYGQGDKYKVLKSLSDSFTYSEIGYRRKFPINKKDTLSFGTNYYDNVFKVSTDLDSLTVHFNPKLRPHRQTTFVKIESPNATQVLYVNFNEMNCWFSIAYMQKAMNQVQYQIPEAYELANVLYALTKSSDSNTNRTLKGTQYHRDVLTYFHKFKNHPLIKHLEFAEDGQGSRDYYNFRDNSYCYTVEKRKIVPNNQYYVVWGVLKDNLFGRYLQLINDFYQKSNFHKFYEDHISYYDTLLKREEQLMPAKKMWDWLQVNFDNKLQSYKIVFSPLISGSHSTQIFAWINDLRNRFLEAVMFVSGTSAIDKRTDLNEKQKEGAASGILFTEIDHNYCNPVSFKYQKAIDSSLSKRSKWVRADGDVELYPTAMTIFNEYITHAVYLLYAYDNLNQKDFEFIKKEREDLMVNHRKYIRFKEFDEQLLKLYSHKQPEEKAKDLFPKIIGWCKNQN